jgi:Protein of unknown function (DUF3489)
LLAAQGPANTDRPKAVKKGRIAGKGAHVAPKKAAGVRDSGKTAKVLDLLKRPGGVTTKELMKATYWQPLARETEGMTRS